MVQIPSGVTWDFFLGSLRAAGNSPSSGQSCPFSVLWGFSLGLSSFSQPPWSRPAEMEILRVASPLLCLDGGINNGFISQPACFAGQCLQHVRGSSIFHAFTFGGKVRGIGFQMLLRGQSYLKCKPIDVGGTLQTSPLKNTLNTQCGSETRDVLKMLVRLSQQCKF